MDAPPVTRLRRPHPAPPVPLSFSLKLTGGTHSSRTTPVPARSAPARPASATARLFPPPAACNPRWRRYPRPAPRFTSSGRSSTPAPPREPLRPATDFFPPPMTVLPFCVQPRQLTSHLRPVDSSTPPSAPAATAAFGTSPFFSLHRTTPFPVLRQSRIGVSSSLTVIQAW